jgi:hypothetical protein
LLGWRERQKKEGKREKKEQKRKKKSSVLGLLSFLWLLKVKVQGTSEIRAVWCFSKFLFLLFFFPFFFFFFFFLFFFKFKKNLNKFQL